MPKQSKNLNKKNNFPENALLSAARLNIKTVPSGDNLGLAPSTLEK